MARRSPKDALQPLACHLLLLLVATVGIGVRITYSVTTGHSATIASGELAIAHNIVADGRWFFRNPQAEVYVEALSKSRGRLVDPASVNYSRLDRNARWIPEASQSVGDSAVIAGLWAITGSERYIDIQVLQGVVDGLAALLVYWIVMQLYRRPRPAIIAAALYALYPPIAWQTANPYNDIWAVDFTIALVAIYLVIRTTGHRWRWLIAGGLCAGAGAYFRPQVLLILPVLALVTITDTGWREAFRRAFATTLVASLVLVPWTIRNYSEFHAFIPLRSGFWETVWSGLYEMPNHFGASFYEVAAEVHRVNPQVVPSTPAWDAYYKPYAIRMIEQRPLFYLETLVHRIAIATVWAHENAWMHRGAGGFHGYQGGLASFLLHRPAVVLQDALEPLVFVLAILGLACTWRLWRRQHTILVALVLCVLLPYLAIHVEDRYLLPAAFVYLIWIALGADLVIERCKRQRSALGQVRSRQLGLWLAFVDRRHRRGDTATTTTSTRCPGFESSAGSSEQEGSSPRPSR
jgi:hypothetical protein